MKTYQVDFEGLVGPTFNYAGLSPGNLRAIRSRTIIANPRAAALEGLAKIKSLADLGVRQALLPPQERPHLPILRALGFRGTDREILQKVAAEAEELLAPCCSASSVWASNSATVTPSVDALDGKLHITPANLITNFHRTLEAVETTATLKWIFPAGEHFVHHPPLPGSGTFSDEGAANHVRLCADYGDSGIHLFVYGSNALRPPIGSSATQPVRQTYEACSAVRRTHGIAAERALFAWLNYKAIDCGVTHNDIIATSDRDVFLVHEDAYIDPKGTLMKLAETFRANTGLPLRVLKISAHDLPVPEAVATGFFNSQLVTSAEGNRVLVAPRECDASAPVRHCLEKLRGIPDCPVDDVRYVDFEHNMRNGAGPACSRLRVVLTEQELSQVHPGVFLTPRLSEELVRWVSTRYRDRLSLQDLADPDLLGESRAALDELTQILGIGPVYSFQR